MARYPTSDRLSPHRDWLCDPRRVPSGPARRPTRASSSTLRSARVTATAGRPRGRPAPGN